MDNKTRLARRMFSFAPSATMAVSGKVAQLKNEGVDIIGFSAGEPDFDVPDFVKDAAIKAIRNGHNKYTPVPGNALIKGAVIDYVKKDLGLVYEKNQVILSLGAKHSLYNLSQAVFDEGDEVIIFSPYWVTYPDQVKLAGAVPVFVDCPSSKGFDPDISELRRKITPNTKAIILNSPCNPTGAVFSDDAIREIAELSVKHDLLLVSDEIYDKVVYDGAKPLSPATLGEEVKKRTVLVNGFSKSFSMTGWRLGYALGPAEIISAMDKLQGQSTSNPVTPVQYAAAEALKDLSFLDAWLQEFKKRRDKMVEMLNDIEGVSCNMPKGAFYAFPDFSGWIGRIVEGIPVRDSLHLTELLIERAHIAPVPGSAFGCENHLRFSYAMSMEDMVEGLSRLAAFARSLG